MCNWKLILISVKLNFDSVCVFNLEAELFSVKLNFDFVSVQQQGL